MLAETSSLLTTGRIRQSLRDSISAFASLTYCSTPTAVTSAGARDEWSSWAAAAAIRPSEHRVRGGISKCLADSRLADQPKASHSRPLVEA